MKRLPAHLSESLSRRLNSYALAASAAGVGGLALAQPAEAKIIYTRTHKVIGLKGVYNLDLNHDGITDFLILDHAWTSSLYNSLYAKEAFGNAVQGYPGWNTWTNLASALKRGVRIGAGQRFVKSGYYGERMASYFRTQKNPGGAGGPWDNVKNGYLGLRFQIEGKTHYGWARMNVSFEGPKIKATLTGYAYETIPNKPIIAGKTKGPDVVTLQDPSLGHLARGASAIPAWRAEETK